MRGLLVGPETAGLARADLNARAHMLLSAFHMFRVWITRVEPDQYVRVAARAADILLRGMGAPGSRWPEGDPLGSDWTLVDEVDTPGDRFLRAATDLLNEKGYRGASVDRISARLNVTKGSFYHHIEHKDDLILACFERTLTAVRRATARAQALDRPGWDQACAMARSLACLQVSAMGPLLRVGALGALPAFDGRAHAYRRMFQLTERIRDIIVTGMMDGSIRPLDSGIAAHLLGGSINSIAELHHWVPSADHHRLVDLYLRPVFEGLLAPPA
jgi:AcrR family transcriptional regulator